MNSKHVILIALVLMLACVPLASAEWMNGVWYTSDQYQNLIAGDTVIHNPVTGVDSKYDNRVGSLYDIQQDPNTYSGMVEVRIRSGAATMNPTMTLVNLALPNVTKEIDVNPNAVTDIPSLPPGNFTLTLNNYDVPDETQAFTIAAGQQTPTYVVFNGQSISQPAVIAPEICKPKIVIERAWYGYDHDGWTNVKSEVQSLVNGGTLSFVFDNRPDPGGIWNIGESRLLYPVADPSYGHIKKIFIAYKIEGCGECSHWMVVRGDEYNVITLTIPTISDKCERHDVDEESTLA
jgi:hypothetical protein